MARRRAKNPWAGYKLPAPRQMTVRYGEFDVPDKQDLGPTGGYTNPQTGEIFLRNPDNFATGHEAFHLLDTIATDSDRARWQKILGYGGQWNQGTGATAGGLQSPSELIADNFGMLASGKDPRTSMDGGYVQGYDYKRMRRLARSLERFRKRNSLDVYDAKAIRREALKRMTG